MTFSITNASGPGRVAGSATGLSPLSRHLGHSLGASLWAAALSLRGMRQNIQPVTQGRAGQAAPQTQVG